MPENNQKPTIDESDVKPTLSEQEIEALEQRTIKEEATADKVETHLEKKKAELTRRRQEAENRKKEARKQIKEVKQELKSPETDDDSDEEIKEQITVEPLVEDEETLYEKFKLRQREEQETESLQKSVDELIEKYPEASADVLQKIEELALSLKVHYPNLSPKELVAKATYLELGETPIEDEDKVSIDAMSSPTGAPVPKSSSIKYQFRVMDSHKPSLIKMGISEEEQLELAKRRYEKGEDISKYGVIKIK